MISNLMFVAFGTDGQHPSQGERASTHNGLGAMFTFSGE
jgi:hypothetical protein